MPNIVEAKAYSHLIPAFAWKNLPKKHKTKKRVVQLANLDIKQYA